MGLTAAVLSSRDVPRGYLPAQDQPAFHGVVPHDPHCRRLLALADGRGLRDVPRSGTAFYQRAPGATLTQHLFRTGLLRAGRTLADARRAIGQCPVLRASVGGVEIALPRAPLKVPELPEKDTVAVRFAGWSDTRHELSYELVLHRHGGTLLVVAQPGVVRRGAPSVAVRAAGRAAARLPGASKLSP